MIQTKSSVRCLRFKSVGVKGGINIEIDSSTADSERIEMSFYWTKGANVMQSKCHT